MAALSATQLQLKDAAYKRHLMAGYSFHILCRGLGPYLEQVSQDLHQDLLNKSYPVPCHRSSDRLTNVKKCPTCNLWLTHVDLYRRPGTQLQWGNTKLEKWSVDNWEVAKTFMNAGQPPSCHNAASTDVSGTLNVLINCNWKQTYTVLNKAQSVRDIRNNLFHSATFQLQQPEFDSILDGCIDLLHEPCFSRFPEAQDGIIKLNELKSQTVELVFGEELEVWRDIFAARAEDTSTKQQALLSSHKWTPFILGFLLCMFTLIIATQVENLKMNIQEGASSSHKDALQLKNELVECYSRPEFTQLSPLVDDDRFGDFIDSVYVEVSLTEKTIEPIRGKRGLEDSIRQQGRPVETVNQMIPPPGGQRILLTGFVGSGKTSLCLYYLKQWTSCQLGNCEVNNALNNYELVIFLRARALENSIYQSIANMLDGEISNAQIKIAQIEAILYSNPSSLIILDGYDEATAQQKVIVDQLVCYKILAKTSIIITSRPNFFYGHITKWYENLGFNYEQQLRYISQFKLTLRKYQVKNYENFEQRVIQGKHSSKQLTSPMIAMTSCTMAAAGEQVDLESRIKNYQQLTDYLARRACFKHPGLINSDKIRLALAEFTQATYFQVLKHKSLQFSREELLVYVSQDTLDNIIVHLGYMAVTKYILSTKTDIAYTFIHKSWAEFTAARYAMSLPIAERCTAVGHLVKSGPANLEVLRFVLGLCGQDEPDYVATLFRAAAKVVTQMDNISDEAFQHEMETIEVWGMADGSSYLMLLLTDVDAHTLPASALWELIRACVVIKLAGIEKSAVNTAIEGHIDVTRTDRDSASALYHGLLLTAHRNQRSLHTVRQLVVWCRPSSPHNAVTRLPATLANCAPHMVALTWVNVHWLVSSKELGEVCGGLAASGAPRLTSLKLCGNSDLEDEAGGNLGALVQLIRVATQLTELRLYQIHCGEEQQLMALCEAVGEALQLRYLELEDCSVKPQQYIALLLPALRRRQAAGGVRLQKVMLYEDMEGENWDGLRAALLDVTDTVDII